MRAASGMSRHVLPILGRTRAERGALIPLRAAAAPLETTTNRALAWGIGLLLGVLTVSTGYVGTPTDFISRVAPVDFLCLALLAVFFVRHRMKPPPPQALLYAAAILISMIPGLLAISEIGRAHV